MGLGPLLGARGGNRCALALISLALEEVDATAVIGGRRRSVSWLRRCAARPTMRVSAETSAPTAALSEARQRGGVRLARPKVDVPTPGALVAESGAHEKPCRIGVMHRRWFR
jgi:hypothetical protein